jgi:hypothetical protein
VTLEAFQALDVGFGDRSMGHPLRVKKGKGNGKGSRGTTVFVCRKCDDHQCVMDVLAKRTDAHVVPVRCQKVCEGALAGVEVEGRLEWFERVSGDRPLAGLVAVVRHGTRPPKPLRSRRVRKMSGRPPRADKVR